MAKQQLVIHSASVWGYPNIRTWEPENPQEIAEVVTLEIGLKPDKGADLFTIRVATPAGLLTLNADHGVLATRPLLIMDRYDFNNLWRWLELTVAKCERSSWKECVEELRLYFNWEYDHYKET